MPSTKYCAKLREGFEDKSDNSTFQKTEGAVSNTQADWRVGKNNAPHEVEIKCCRSWQTGKGPWRGQCVGGAVSLS